MAGHNGGGGSSTMTIELPSYDATKTNTPQTISRTGSTKEQFNIVTSDGGVVGGSGGQRLGSTHSSSEGVLPSPITATPVLTRWNHPRSNAYRLFACFWSFVVLGANDAAYGALIPYLETYYNVNYTVISLVFLSPIVGYTASALTNNLIHMRFGQRGVAIVMSFSHVIAYTIISLHPPFPALVAVFVLAGFGNGLGDSGWNAWVGDMANANEVLGFLHGFFGLGAAISPLVATAVVTKAGWQWYEFYYLMVGAAVIEVISLVGTFWKSDGAKFRADHSHTAAVDDVNLSLSSLVVVEGIETTSPAHGGNVITNNKTPKWYIRINPFKNPKSRTAEAVKDKVTIISAFFLLVYVGIEVSIGGWIVTFMLRVRSASKFASGLSATAFWLGITVGRLALGFVTARVFRTEKHAIATYLAACVGLQLLLWLVPQFIVSAVMVGLLGFFLGPLFPAAVVAMTKLLPKRLHVAGIGFAAAFGASGACILPFAVGAIANARGVAVLQPIVLAMLVVALGIWLCLPALPKQRTS